MIHLRFIVVGTGRCGTVYAAKLLTGADIPCAHEGIFCPLGITEAIRRLKGESPVRNSPVSLATGEWLPENQPIGADASYMATPFLGEDCLASTDLIHLVRHPVDVVFSFVKDLSYFVENTPDRACDDWQRFIYSHLPELTRLTDPISRAVAYYVLWNRMIEKHAASAGRRYLRHRVEDGPEAILRFVGAYGAEAAVDRKVNTLRHRARSETINDIPEGGYRQELIAMGRSYGYAFPQSTGRSKLML